MPNFSESKENVVIVRAGQKSLHKRWHLLPYHARNFDLVVSYFDEAAFRAHEEEAGVYAFLCIGGKWDGIYRTLDWMDQNFPEYEYYWLPDDDIDADSVSINLLFDAMKGSNLGVAQPSLTPDSYFTHFLFINCPGVLLRYTNYVEIMVPCLARDVLVEVKPHFKETMSGFGLDYIWARLSTLGSRRAAILDLVQVRHTRPVGNVLVSAMAKQGRSPKREEEVLKSLYGIADRITPLVYEMLTVSGRHINGLSYVGLEMSIRHLRRVFFVPKHARFYGIGKVYQLLRRQLTRKLDLKPIKNIG